MPQLILSDTVLVYRVTSSPVDFSLRVSLSPSRRRWPRPSCDRPYPFQRLEDLLGRLVRASGSLSSLRAAIADRSHASRRTSSASLRPLSCARLSHSYLYGHKLATVDLLNLRHGAILSPLMPLTRPRSAYTDPELTWMAAPTLCDIPRHSSPSPMFCCHRTHVMPLLPHCVACQYT